MPWEEKSTAISETAHWHTIPSLSACPRALCRRRIPYIGKFLSFVSFDICLISYSSRFAFILTLDSRSERWRKTTGLHRSCLLKELLVYKCVKIILLETLFSPGFHTNLVSMRKLENNGLIWNPRAGVLETESPVTAICGIERKLRTYFIEWNEPSVSDVMISRDAIRHLEDAVEVVDAGKKSDVSPCETYSLSAAPRQILTPVKTT